MNNWTLPYGVEATEKCGDMTEVECGFIVHVCGTKEMAPKPVYAMGGASDESEPPMIGQHNVFADAAQCSEGLQYWHRWNLWVISIISVPHTPGPVLWTCLCISLHFSAASSVCVGVSNYSRCPIIDVLL